jgi:hypothetical protein
MSLRSLLTAANLSAYAFGAVCFLSAPPFMGLPVPRRASAEYYAQKNIWLASISPIPMTPKTAGYFGAVLRVGLGLGLVVGGQWRTGALVVMGSVVGVGTVLAARDGRPMGPQWLMLAATALVWLANG